MKTERYIYNHFEIELEYLEQENVFWPNRFQVKVPVEGGNFQWRGEQYEQASFTTKEECFNVMKRDAQKFVDRL